MAQGRHGDAGQMDTGSLPDGIFTLDQLLTFQTSRHWQYNKKEFREMIILLDESLPAMMHVEIESYEITEPMNAARLVAVLKLPDDQFAVAPRRLEELQGRIFHFEGQTDSGVRVLVWKRTMMLGVQLRIATFALQIRPGKEQTATAAAITSKVIDTVKTATFASQIMATDRIAPTDALKQTSVSTVLRFRVPGDWIRGRVEEWTIFDSGDRDRGVFEATYDCFPFSVVPNSADMRARVLFLLNSDHPGIADADDFVVFEEIDDSFDPPELTVTFRRILLRGADVLDIWFRYRVVATQAQAPAVRDLIALFDREVRLAVIDFPKAPEGSEGVRA
jgi:hypothetical protein